MSTEFKLRLASLKIGWEISSRKFSISASRIIFADTKVLKVIKHNNKKLLEKIRYSIKQVHFSILTQIYMTNIKYF